MMLKKLKHSGLLIISGIIVALLVFLYMHFLNIKDMRQYPVVGMVMLWIFGHLLRKVAIKTWIKSVLIIAPLLTISYILIIRKDPEFWPIMIFFFAAAYLGSVNNIKQKLIYSIVLLGITITYLFLFT